MAKQKEASHQESVRTESPKNNHQQIMKLMKKLGVPGYNPLPTEHHLWFLEQPDISDDEIKFWSWHYDHTLAYRPGRDRSDFAVDDLGHEVHIKDAARDLSWKLKKALEIWRKQKRRGVGRNGTAEEGRERLYICGKPLLVKHLPVEQEPEPKPETDPQRELEKLCAKFCSPIFRRQFSRLTEDRQKALVARLKDKDGRAKRFRADVDKGVRAIIERIEDSILSEFGIAPRRIPPEKRKNVKADRKHELEERDKRIQPLIEALGNFAGERHSFDFGEEKLCVKSETGDGEKLYAKAEIAVAQSSHPYITEKIQRENVSPHKSVDVPIDINAAGAAPTTTNEAAKAAEKLFHILADSHRKLQAPGEMPRAVKAATEILATAPDIDLKCKEIIASHAAWMRHWKAERASNPNSLIYYLWNWFEKGLYLYPPDEEAIQSAVLPRPPANGGGKKKPAWVDEYRAKYSGGGK
jgi:hypothetical protein